MTRTLRTTGWILMTLSASAIALLSLRYFTLDQNQFAEPLREKFAQHIPLLLMHVSGGVLALFLGPWQFWGALRKKSLTLHRWIGRVYLGAIFVGASGGFLMAFIALGGLPTQMGLGMLAVVWMATTVLAYQRARQRDIDRHREWMIRSYSLTFAAVTFRLWLGLFIGLGFSFLESYMTVAWMCWVPNLLAAELFIGLAKARKEEQRVKAETTSRKAAAASPVQVAG